MEDFIKTRIREYLNENYENLIYYHGTGEKHKVIEALKNGTFIFHKSGGVVDGIYLTPNKELAIKYSDIATGNDKGVIEIKLKRAPKLKVYKNAAEKYDEEMGYNLHNTKDASLKYREDMLANGYDGTQTGGDVIMMFKEKINILEPIKSSEIKKE
jgi:hypothetical protein